MSEIVTYPNSQPSRGTVDPSGIYLAINRSVSVSMEISQWEYEVVIVKRDAIGAKNRSPDYEPSIDLDRFGAEGWELVALVPIADWYGESGGYTSRLQYVFKRARQNA